MISTFGCVLVFKEYEWPLVAHNMPNDSAVRESSVHELVTKNVQVFDVDRRLVVSLDSSMRSSSSKDCPISQLISILRILMIFSCAEKLHCQ